MRPKGVSKLSKFMRVITGLFFSGMTAISTVAISPDQLTRQITKNPANDYHVKWSPDGKMLAFASLRSGEPKIWLIPAEGGEAALLETGLSGDHHISWAPDGKRLTFDARWNGRPNIFTISLADGKTQRLSPDGTIDFQPSWSPDGSRIAFASLRAGNADIWLMPSEGGQAIQLTHDAASTIIRSGLRTAQRSPSRRIGAGIGNSGSWPLPGEKPNS